MLSLSEILDLLQEYIDSLEGDELNQECRQAGTDFYNFLKAKRYDLNLVTPAITELTGKHPRQLYKVSDARKLRSAIWGYRTVPLYISDRGKGGNPVLDSELAGLIRSQFKEYPDA